MRPSTVVSTHRTAAIQRHEWMPRIVNELYRLEHESDLPGLILLNDLGFSMLEGCDSRAGVEWLEAVQDLETRGTIVVDAAGYVALTGHRRAGTRASS